MIPPLTQISGGIGGQNSNLKSPSLPFTSSRKQTKDELSSVMKDSRIFETGSIQRFNSHDFVLCFESEPFWIMSLNLILTKSLLIDNAISTFSEFHTYLSQFRRYNIFVSRLGRSKFQFYFQSNSVSSDAILLISGIPEFFNFVSPDIHPCGRRTCSINIFPNTNCPCPASQYADLNIAKLEAPPHTLL